MTNGAIGTKGFVIWFYILVYMKIVKACKNNFIRLSIHSIGLITTIVGLYAFITSKPSLIGIFGIILIFTGIIIFVIPFGANT